MLINHNTTEKLIKLFLATSKETAIAAHHYIQTHNKIYGLGKYPEKQVIFPKDNPEFAEMYDLIPFLRYGIPRYREVDFPEGCINYSGIFWNFSKDHVDCTSTHSFSALMDYVKSESSLSNIWAKNENGLVNKLKRAITDIVERYLFVTKATENIPNDLEIQLEPFVVEKVLRYIKKNLNISIYIPICLATFEDELIKLSKGISIVKISEEIQKSRQCSCRYESSKEDWVAACASHMIVMENYHFENSDDLSINSATQNCYAYPLQIIDNVFASIRIATGYSIGYEQILSHPEGWIDSFHGDLMPLYGAKAHYVNPQYSEKIWMDLPVSRVSSEQAKMIKTIYQSIAECEDDKNKQKLIFALKRFNRCMLRNETDDMATDATIGIEALLAGGTKGEITYTISNRVPVVFAYVASDLFSPSNSRNLMKKVYNYRSKIVHGSRLKDQDQYIEINGTKYMMWNIAVEFLRYALMFITMHQEYLDAAKFDECLDNLLLSQMNREHN